MPSLITPVILSGGSGTRLWPLSVPERPKQFIPLVTGKTMFAETLSRVSDSQLFANPIIVGAERHEELIAAELATGKTIYEPCPRGTAPAIAMAALEAGADDTLLLVLSSDHSILRIDEFLNGIKAAASVAAQNWLVCLGIQPTYPETGYGYIELADSEIEGVVRRVSRFVEKPSLNTAQQYLDDGRYVWNAGIFLFRADQILEAIKLYDPNLFNLTLKAWENARRNGNMLNPQAASFEAIKTGAIDTVVMERAKNVACVPVDMGWSDVGSWDALYELAAKDSADNILTGNVVALNCKDSLIRGDNICVAAFGVSNLIIVATENGVIVIPRGQSQQIKTLFDHAPDNFKT